MFSSLASYCATSEATKQLPVLRRVLFLRARRGGDGDLHCLANFLLAFIPFLGWLFSLSLLFPALEEWCSRSLPTQSLGRFHQIDTVVIKGNRPAGFPLCFLFSVVVVDFDPLGGPG